MEGQSGRSGFEDQLLLVMEALAVGPHQTVPAGQRPVPQRSQQFQRLLRRAVLPQHPGHQDSRLRLQPPGGARPSGRILQLADLSGEQRVGCGPLDASGQCDDVAAAS